MKNFLRNNWILLLILTAAFFFRFWQINHLPGGLFPDEAANGLDINSIFKGDVHPFYERGNGREALFFYFIAGVVALFGRGPWQHHIVSAGFGFLAVVATYFLVKRLFGKRTALLATFFMAISSYAVTVTRTAFRATMVPLLATLTIFFLVKFFQSTDKKTKTWSAILGGLSFALGLYTYTPFRMMIPLIGSFFLILLFGYRDKFKWVWKEYKKYSAIFIASFVVGIAWIASYYFKHPSSFLGRSGQVSVFNKELNNGDLIGTFISVFKKTITSFFTNGDTNWRHNVAGFPFLTPILSIFFAVSLIIMTLAIFLLLEQAWQKKIKSQTFYLVIIAYWFWAMVVPEATTAEGIPHGLRLIGTIPAIFILAAWSVNWLWEKFSENNVFYRYRKIFAAIFLSALFVYNFYLYFGVAANSPEYYYSFRSDLTNVSNYLNERNLKNKTYLSLDTFSVQTTDYLTTPNNQPYILLDPANTYKASLKPGDQVVFTMSSLYDRIKFLQYHSDAKLVHEEKNQFGQLIMLVYQQP